MSVTQLDHLNLSVRDFDETADWYRRVFGFEVVEDETDARGVRWGVLKAGEAMLCIYQHPNLEFAGCEELRRRGLHSICHFALRITDRTEWEETIERENIPLEYLGEVAYPHSTSWYISDPTGWKIEVALWEGDRATFDA